MTYVSDDRPCRPLWRGGGAGKLPGGHWRLGLGPLLLLVVVGLSACSSGYAPVSERSLRMDGAEIRQAAGKTPPSDRAHAAAAKEHLVVAGDTLYSIAWRYDKDYRVLARLNAIGSDYRIFPGQRLQLTGSMTSAARATSAKAGNATPPTVQARRAASAPAAAEAKVPPKTVSSPPRSQAPLSGEAKHNRPLVWRWPADGELLGGFDSQRSLNRGVDIAGTLGDPVFAASDGRVVYAGSGLLGYGNLIIINHNEEYLSAYAHNNKLLVQEQDLVRMGDKIAVVGKSGAPRTMLHFEIRRDGKPVDPLRYLPKR